jgi:hypothetical protein
MAHADIILGDQDLDGIDLDDRSWRGRRRGVGPAGEQCSNSACGEGNTENEETRGFHTLTSHDHASGREPASLLDFTSETSIHG